MDLDSLIKHTCFGHSRQVSKISALLAESSGFSPDDTSVIEQAALYHDIGKSDIPEQILNKPGALTPDEFEVVKTHTVNGYNKITNTISVLNVAAEVCRDHHERLDGTGYGGIAGPGIHPFVKLISVADVFDALYSKRSYKAAWGVPEILVYFKEQSGTQFDSEVVLLLSSVIDRILPLYQ